MAAIQDSISPLPRPTSLQVCLIAHQPAFGLSLTELMIPLLVAPQAASLPSLLRTAILDLHSSFYRIT